MVMCATISNPTLIAQTGQTCNTELNQLGEFDMLSFTYSNSCGFSTQIHNCCD